MALLGDFKNGYTKTGGNWFSRMSGYMSYVPWVGVVVAPILGYIGTALDAGGWLLRGKVGSAVTTATTGIVASTVNGIEATGLTWGSYFLTGRSMGTHARKLTEAGISTVGGAVGFKPQVLRSYTAGIGSIGGGVAQSAPGRFASQISAERGQDANAAYANYMRGDGGVHVNELQSANGRGM